MLKEEDIIEAEKKSKQRINDPVLLESIEKLTTAAKTIWNTEGPIRIIKDFTDHGINHSRRLIYYSEKLLDENNGRPLSKIESYLLVAGAYLHDIGMQCDINRYPGRDEFKGTRQHVPGIKERAEKIDAKFDVEFTAKTANSYSKEEQDSIRKNHHLLTAAWIDYAYETGESILGSAIKTIPEDLITDLTDICRFHSKLAIKDCPLNFISDKTERKQFIAAILRFSDELDVDYQRVSIDIPENFRLDPSSSIYWWIHSLTRVKFYSSNVITLNIRLHPEDTPTCSSFIFNVFIKEFLNKNKPVIEILWNNDIKIYISADSEVNPDPHARKLPLDIVKLIQFMEGKPDSLFRLINEVKICLQAIGYKLSGPMLVDNRTADMISILEKDRSKIYIRCIDGEITKADVISLEKVSKNDDSMKWLISERRISNLARTRAAETGGIEIFNSPEFLLKRIWKPYFDALKALVEADDIRKLYRDPSCYKFENDDERNLLIEAKYISLDNYINDCVMDHSSRLIFLLGDTGKTWFSRHFAYNQLEKYEKDSTNTRLPLLVTFPRSSRSKPVWQLVNDLLLEQYNLQFADSIFGILQEMNRRGELLLILDGFDKAINEASSGSLISTFLELIKSVGYNSKVIMTMDKNYLDIIRVYSNLYSQINPRLEPLNYEILYIGPFTQTQIHEIIENHVGSVKSKEMVGHILDNEELKKVANTPNLFRLLLIALSECPDFPLNRSEVFLYATKKLLCFKPKSVKKSTNIYDKIFLIGELTFKMIMRDNVDMISDLLPDKLANYLEADKLNEIDISESDIFKKIPYGETINYKLAYSCLPEYFVALKFSIELGCLNSKFAQIYFSEEDGFNAVNSEKSISDLSETFGQISFMDDKRNAIIGDFLKDMLANDSRLKLERYINDSGKVPSDDGMYINRNLKLILELIT